MSPDERRRDVVYGYSQLRRDIEGMCRHFVLQGADPDDLFKALESLCDSARFEDRMYWVEEEYLAQWDEKPKQQKPKQLVAPKKPRKAKPKNRTSTKE